MADVFVSYKRQDRARVSVIAGLLNDLGLSVWFDASLAAGERWRQEINEEIDAASAMLACWTPAATQSVEVMREVMLGLQRGILAPVFLQPCALPAGLDTIHAPDLSAVACGFFRKFISGAPRRSIRRLLFAGPIGSANPC